MPPSDAPHPNAHPGGHPDDFTNRNAFLDCLLGVIALCERTVSAISGQSEDPPAADPPATGDLHATVDGPVLR